VGLWERAHLSMRRVTWAKRELFLANWDWSRLDWDHEPEFVTFYLPILDFVVLLGCMKFAFSLSCFSRLWSGAVWVTDDASRFPFCSPSYNQQHHFCAPHFAIHYITSAYITFAARSLLMFGVSVKFGWSMLFRGRCPMSPVPMVRISYNWWWWLHAASLINDEYNCTVV